MACMALVIEDKLETEDSKIVRYWLFWNAIFRKTSIWY